MTGHVLYLAAAFESYHPPRLEATRRLLAAQQKNLTAVSLASSTADVLKVLSTHSPDVVVICGWNREEYLLALRWAGEHRRKVVLVSDSTEHDHFRVRLLEAWKAVIVRQCDAFFTAGKPQLRYLSQLGAPPEKIFQGCDVVDNDFFSDQRPHDSAQGLLQTLRVGPCPFFICVSRLIRRKNIARLLDAYSIYSRTTSNPWGLVIVGGGPERNALEERAKQLCAKGVRFAGRRSPDELAMLYGASRCLVHPARMDTWGLVVNEAMASGLPVLVSNETGCREDLVENGINGWSFDSESIQGIAEVMAQMHALAPEKRQAMGSQSKVIIDRWTLETHAHGLSNAIEASQQKISADTRDDPPSALWWHFSLMMVRARRQINTIHPSQD
ncbi:MAG: glycosyltransferase family 4 protein [Myxococcales bacterium]|nr:glycosyltransferase family 4 protein [Myxococcales bacterium]